MNLSTLSIQRPVLATVISLVLLLFGGLGFVSLGVREYPVVEPPIVTVTTNYTGANADVIESQITEPLEESINGISGIRSLSSISSDGRSTITVEFTVDVNIEDAANDVRDRVSRAVRNLPPDADPPIVQKSEADGTPILSMTIQSPERDMLELTDIATNLFKERLQTIPGVSEIRIWGEKKYSMRLILDPVRMASFGLTAVDVQRALAQQNIELPSGRVEGQSTELSIRTEGRLTSPREFENLMLRETNGSTVRLRDVGRAVELPENDRTALYGNGGIPMVAVAVTPQTGSNYIAIADEFYRRVERLRQEMPQDLQLNIAIDTTTTIRTAILEVEETLLIAFGLVVLVIFLFLQSWRTTLIPVLAIPISLIATFFIMYVAGFSINVLTLLGIVLATGLVVDDAIVVMENIFQKIEEGLSPMQAGIEGSQEIFFAIVSTTVTLAAVFLPVVFLEGVTGKLFMEFGVVVAGSVLISAVVSLTLTPMLSTRLLRKTHNKPRAFRALENGIEGMRMGYARSLQHIIRKSWIAFVVMAGSVAIVIGIGGQLQSELAPMDDKGRLLIRATAPEGTTFDLMDDYVQYLLSVGDTIPEKAAMIAVTSPSFGASVSANSAFLRMSLVPADQRTRTQAQIADIMSAAVKANPFARGFVVQEQTIQIGFSQGMPVQFVLQAPNFERLKEVLPQFMERVQQSPVFQFSDLDLEFNKPELRLEVDRDRAQTLGVSVQDVALTLQLYFSGQRLGFYIRNGKQYQVIAQAERPLRDDPQDLTSILVRSSTGALIPLSNLVRVSEQVSPPQLFRYNRYVSATVQASPANGYTLAQGVDEMRRIAAEVLDDSFTTALNGPSRDLEESSSSLVFAFVLALVLIFLVLAAQFESFLDPILIMLTVPLAIAGAVLSLWLTDQTLNLFSQIGVIILIGIVTKNGILIIEFANQKVEQGMTKMQAAMEAAKMRFRPILMTSLATALGALPIALALGAAARSRMSMGIVVIGGLLFSLVLTLYVIPMLYVLLSRKKAKNPIEYAAEGTKTPHPETDEDEVVI